MFNIKSILIFLCLITCICAGALLYLIPTANIPDSSKQQSEHQQILGDQMAKVEIYTKSYCPYCVKAKALLKKKNVTFEEIDIEHDQTVAIKVMERSGGRKTVPQIFIDGTHVGGCDDLYALDDTGKLDEMLK